MELLEKRPGAISGCLTKVVFVRMLCPVGSFDEHTTLVNNLRAKCNNALNDSAANVDEFMLTITSCQQHEHFDKKGKLSANGMSAFFLELDDLLQQFDLDKIKLKPMLKMKYSGPDHMRYHVPHQRKAVNNRRPPVHTPYQDTPYHQHYRHHQQHGHRGFQKTNTYTDYSDVHHYQNYY